MKLELAKRSELVSRPWPGGTTTQLAIFPRDASYPDRNFQFRLSTSEVQAQESVFTYLPGVSRSLLVLNGELQLRHPGRYVKTLKKFESDTFMGDWQTRSTGRATDFNLMMTGSIRGRLEGINLRKGGSRNIELSESVDVAGIYSYKGGISVEVSGQLIDLGAGDNLLVFTNNSTNIIRIVSKSTSELVMVNIQF